MINNGVIRDSTLDIIFIFLNWVSSLITNCILPVSVTDVREVIL